MTTYKTISTQVHKDKTLTHIHQVRMPNEGTAYAKQPYFVRVSKAYELTSLATEDKAEETSIYVTVSLYQIIVLLAINKQ